MRSVTVTDSAKKGEAPTIDDFPVTKKIQEGSRCPPLLQRDRGEVLEELYSHLTERNRFSVPGSAHDFFLYVEIHQAANQIPGWVHRASTGSERAMEPLQGYGGIWWPLQQAI